MAAARALTSLLLLVGGIYAATYLIYAKLMVQFQAPGFASECNISQALNCDALMDGATGQSRV